MAFAPPSDHPLVRRAKIPLVPVTVTIITKNEADHIAAAIDSAAWADEIVVVDSHSTDETVAIARAKGVRVAVRDWTGWVDQKNFAASLASHDWIFSLDADERVPLALAEEIRRVIAGPSPRSAYRVPRITFHLGRWVRTTDWYPDDQLRLYDRRTAEWTGGYVHEGVTVRGSVGQLRGELQHYAFRDIADHLETIDRYTTYAARQMHESGRHASALQLAFHPPLAFLRNYILRGGLRDGAVGFVVSVLNSYYVFLKFAKLWELQHTTTAHHEATKDAKITNYFS